jgi:hypothetical protein
MTATKTVPAAQYLRMSTEHQQYSIDGQSTAIEAYANLLGFEIVQSYSDSALRANRRRGKIRRLAENENLGRACELQPKLRAKKKDSPETAKHAAKSGATEQKGKPAAEARFTIHVSRFLRTRFLCSIENQNRKLPSVQGRNIQSMGLGIERHGL